VNEVYPETRFLTRVLSGDRRLSAECPGGVHRDVAPAGTRLPYVLLVRMSGADWRGIGRANRLGGESVYQAKVVGDGARLAPLEAAAHRLDELLEVAEGFEPGDPETGLPRIDFYGLAREGVIDLPERTDQGTYLRHVGGFYRLYWGVTT
jgi:hypothetical protein